MIWVPVSATAGMLQACRNAVQARLKGTLSTNGASFVRFAFGLPVAAILLAGYGFLFGGVAFPAEPTFWLWAVLGGVGQILATNFMLIAFSHRNVIAGTAYVKTETLQVALIAWAFLGEALSWLIWLGALVSMAGLLLLSFQGRKGWLGTMLRSFGTPAALTGMFAGFLFALTMIFIKLATADVPVADGTLRALTTLVAMLSLQTPLQGAYLWLREREQFAAIGREAKLCALAGFFSAVGSAFWFTGYVLAPIALVRIVGQVEALFTIGLSHFWLKEGARREEMLGLLLLVGGIILALAAKL